MEEVEAIPHLRETLLFLALAGILVPFLQRLRVGSVTGYLAVGMLLGPFGLGRLAPSTTYVGRVMSWLAFPQLEAVSVLASIGVVFLMFMIGLELSARRLWSMRRWVFGAGAAQVVVSAALIFSVGVALGASREAALVVGLALSFSSTAVTMQLLTARHELATSLGQASFAVLLFQDLAVVPVLILVSLLARPGDSSVLLVLSLALGRAAIAIAVIFVLGRVVLGPLFRQFTSNRQADTFMALTLLASLSIASLTWLAGLSMALGAMLAGLLLAETEYRHQVVVMIDPFRGLLMGVFFLSVGMSIDPLAVVHQPLKLLLAVAGLFALKTLVTAAVLRAGGLPARSAIHGGLLLGQGSEFAFVVFGVATALGLLEAEAGRFLLLVVGVSMFVAPLAADLGRRIAASGHSPTAPVDERAPVAPTTGGHVVIAGFGRVGQSLARMLDAQAIPYVAVDPDPHVVSAFHAKGWPVYVGDASRGDLLRRLDLSQASAVVLTMDQPVAAVRAVRAIRGDAPDVAIFARARDERHASALHTAGADAVIPETLESALQLGALALGRAGMPEAELHALLASERTERIATYRNQSSNGSPT